MQWAKSVFINFLALIRNRGEGMRQSEKVITRLKVTYSVELMHK